jgi:hypothetical protein
VGRGPGQCGWVVCRTDPTRGLQRAAGRFLAKQLRRDRDVSFAIAAHEVGIGPRGGATRTPACDHPPMSEPDPERSSFEDVARALADEVSGAIERLSEIDLDEIARAASAEGERARQWIDDLGRWLREQSGAWEHGPAPADRSTPGRPTGDDPLRHAGPHPLDLPTPDQGVALAALDSGRWRVEPGTSALAVHGEGPGPSDALGLVRELRVRDWMTVDGQITLAGRDALNRWLDAADR